MGLDGVEIVMAVEDRFGIVLKWDEVGGIRTVGDLVDVVRTRMMATATTTAPLRSQWIALQGLVGEITGETNLRFRPSDRLQDRLSLSARRQLWQRLPELLHAFPRPLTLAKPLRILLMSIFLTLFLIAIGISFFTSELWMIPLVLLASAFMGILILLISPRFGTVAPRGWMTFGEVTRQLVKTRIATKNVHLQTGELILQELRPILVENLNIPPAKVLLSARLIEDLGMS
jgi:acyl carrier protein